MPRISSALVRAKTLRMSSSTMRIRLPWNTESAVRSCESSLRVAAGGVASMRCRKKAGSFTSPQGVQEGGGLSREPLGAGHRLGVEPAGELLELRPLGAAQRLRRVEDERQL